MLKKIANKIWRNSEKKNLSDLNLFSLHNNSHHVASAKDYRNNVIVHRCVSLIAQSASHVPWKIYHDINGKRKLIEHHPVSKILKKPNLEMAGADFFTEVIANLLLYGNSYIVINLLKNGQIAELYTLNPELTEIIFNNGTPVAYKFSGFNKQKVYPIDKINRKSQILHIASYNPEDRYYGLSSLKAASKSINLHNQTIEWNKALLKNSARPSGALVFQDGNGYLSDDQFERLKEQFYENFSGSSNGGKPIILEGGLKWQDTSSAEKLEKFLELKDSSARDIAMAFNVPPQLLGINGDNTYSNMQEARLALWEENIVPLLDKLSDSFSSWLSYWYNESLIIDFDRDSISTLTEKRQNLWSKISSANFMTINEKRAMVGLGPIAEGDRLI